MKAIVKKPKSGLNQNNQSVKRDNYTAEEIGEASAYEGETEIAQRIRRGDETKGNPNERDIVGVVKSEDLAPEISPKKNRTQ